MSISPNIPSPQESFHYESTGTPRWIAVLFGIVIAAMAVLGYAAIPCSPPDPGALRAGETE